MVLETPFGKGTHTEAIDYFARCSVRLWTVFFQHISVTTVQDTVTKPNRCVFEIEMKAELEDGCRSGEGAGTREVGSRKGRSASTLSPWPTCILTCRSL